MNCDICSRAPSTRLPFYCPTCARSGLYEQRIEVAAILLEKEAKGRQIEKDSAAWRLPAEDLVDPARITAETDGQIPRNWVVHAISREQAESATRTQALAGHIERLRARLKEKRNDVTRRRGELERRYADAESAKYQIKEREAVILSGTQNSIKRTEQRWNALHAMAVDSRVYLCKEAAALYGLRRLVESENDGSKDIYILGGVPIIDLRDMNGKPFCSRSMVLYMHINQGMCIYRSHAFPHIGISGKCGPATRSCVALPVVETSCGNRASPSRSSGAYHILTCCVVCLAFLP